jgi:hypothetical protein
MIRVVALFGILFLNGAICRADVEALTVKGSVWVSTNRGQSWEKLKARKIFKDGVQFKTGTNGVADFRFPDGSLMRVPTNSVVGVDKSVWRGKDMEIQVDLRNGRVIGIGREFKESSHFETKTPVGVCGVRGTDTAFDATSRGVMRCALGDLVVVYVVGGLIPPASLKNGQQIQPPGNWLAPIQPVEIPKEQLEGLEKELNELRKSSAPAKKAR